MLSTRKVLLEMLFVSGVALGASGYAQADCNSDFRFCKSTARDELNYCISDCNSARCRNECRDWLDHDLDKCDSSADLCLRSYSEYAPTNPGAGYYRNPGYANPGYANPGYTNPGYTNPGYTNPGYANPGYANPGYANPGTFAQPNTKPPLGTPTGPCNVAGGYQYRMRAPKPPGPC
jgi:hypothetical protein